MTFKANSDGLRAILVSDEVAGLCELVADAVLEAAVASAPVDTGEYSDGLRVERVRNKDRVVARVVGDDWKTMLVESQTGNLVRALKSVTR